MKKMMILTASLLCSTLLFSQSGKLSIITGKWDIVGEQGGATLEIVDSSNITLTYMGEQRKISNYTIDFSKSPYWFDFSAADSASTIEVKSLIQVVGTDLLKWQLFIDEERSPYFTASKGEVFYLKKARPGATVTASR